MTQENPVSPFTLHPFDRENRQQVDWLADFWNAACGQEFAVSPAFIRFNTRPTSGAVQAGRIAVRQGEPVGFVLASAHSEAPAPMDRSAGWIDALAVVPSAQRHGIGRALVAWAEAWLAGQNCSTVLLGGSLRPFVPGLPVDLATTGFFTALNYRHQQGGYVWDVARDLSDYVPPSAVEGIAAAARPAQPGQETLLLDFLAREFPGRWHFECEEFLREGGRISDYMLLWTETGVQGACRLTFEDSTWPIERYFPYGLARPWGQLGSIGVAETMRGQGLGLTLLDAGLRRLHDNGVNGCVIDWTTILDFYAKAGFESYHRYAKMAKSLT